MISVVCYLPEDMRGWDAIMPLYNWAVGMAYDPTRWIREKQSKLANQMPLCDS